MAGYCSSSFFCVLMDQDGAGSTDKHAKEKKITWSTCSHLDPTSLVNKVDLLYEDQERIFLTGHSI